MIFLQLYCIFELYLFTKNFGYQIKGSDKSIMNIFHKPIGNFYIDTKTYSKGFEMPRYHYHSCYEICIIISGKRTLFINDSISHGETGSVFLIPPQAFHRAKGTQCQRIVINFSDKFLNSFLTLKTTKRLTECFKKEHILLNQTNFERIVNLCEQIMSSEKTEDDIIPVLAQILVLLNKNSNNTLEDNEDKKTLITEILKYINENYTNINNLDELAKRFFISKEYLCKTFKKNVDMTIFSYITSLRLGLACQLLSSTTKTLTKVSYECGFNSSSYFSKVFSKMMQMTPTEYRNKFSEKMIE